MRAGERRGRGAGGDADQRAVRRREGADAADAGGGRQRVVPGGGHAESAGASQVFPACDLQTCW